MLTATHTRDEIQAALDEGGTVEFAPGIYENAHYRLMKPVRLIGNGAVLVGGGRIRWTEEENGVLSCSVSQEEPIRELMVGGGLRMRCRLPESGYWQHETIYPHQWLGTTKGGWEVKPTEEQMVTMRVKPGALDGLTLHSAEATVVHSWDDSLLRIKEAAGDVVTFCHPGTHPVGGFKVKDYCLWNVPEAFREAGTFYHDLAAGKLYYRPLPDENAETEAYLPTYESIFYAEDAVEGVEISGFTLTATAAPHVNAGFGAYRMTGAIDFGAVSDSLIHDMTIHAVGGYGIRTTGAVCGVRIERCEIFDTGAGGIRLGSGRDVGKSEICDCFVYHVGRYQPSAIGIAAVNCHIRHNEVCHTSYSAINCAGSDFVVEKNVIHDTMEVLNDGAAIYSFGSHNGILRENLAYGIHPKKGHFLRIAFYLDEVSSGWLVERNVAVDCGFPNHNHMCGMHLYRENLFVNEGGSVIISLQRTDGSIRYIGNVLSAGKRIIFRIDENGMKEFESNRYHSEAGGIVRLRFDKNDVPEEIPVPVTESNRRIDAVHFEEGARIFEAAGLKIDLRDAGVRKQGRRKG